MLTIGDEFKTEWIQMKQDILKFGSWWQVSIRSSSLKSKKKLNITLIFPEVSLLERALCIYKYKDFLYVNM